MYIRITNQIDFSFNAEINNESDLENSLLDAKIEYAKIFMPDAAQIKAKLDSYQNEIDTNTVRNLHVIRPFMSKFECYLNRPNELHLHIFSGDGWDYVKTQTYSECYEEYKKGKFFDDNLRRITNFVSQ